MALAPATVQRMPARLSRAPICLHPASDHARRHAQALGPELRIAHPVAVADDVLDALAGLGRVGVGVQGRDQVSEASGVQLGLPVLCPLLGERRPGPVDGFGHVTQMLLGVVDVDDLDGVGKLLVGQVPDPGGAVAEDDLSGGGDEAAPLRLAMGALGEGGRLRVGVAAGRALDGGVVADRPRVATKAGPRPSRPSAVHAVASLTSRVLAEPSGCLPRAPGDPRSGGTGTPVPSSPRYIVGAGDGAVCSWTALSSRAISRPSASAQRSTCRVSTSTPARATNNSLALAKLTSAAVMPTSRVAPGDSEVSCRSRARSRGQLPRWQAGQ